MKHGTVRDLVASAGKVLWRKYIGGLGANINQLINRHLFEITRGPLPLHGFGHKLEVVFLRVSVIMHDWSLMADKLNHHECLDTQHTYIVLNTTLHTVLYTVMYTVMYTVLYNRLAGWLSWLIPWGSPASCTLYLTLNFHLYWILYCTIYSRMYCTLQCNRYCILTCTKHKSQRYWLCWLNPE